MDFELFIEAKELPESLREYFPNKDLVSVQDIIDGFYNLDEDYRDFRENVNEFYVYKPDKYSEPSDHCYL